MWAMKNFLIKCLPRPFCQGLERATLLYSKGSIESAFKGAHSSGETVWKKRKPIRHIFPSPDLLGTLTKACAIS